MEGITMAEVSTKPAAKILGDLGLTGMDIVRLCGISTRIAYLIVNGKPIKSPATFHKLTTGLLEAGYYVKYEDLAGISGES
jgi:hypothetical protein